MRPTNIEEQPQIENTKPLDSSALLNNGIKEDTDDVEITPETTHLQDLCAAEEGSIHEAPTPGLCVYVIRGDSDK